MDRCKILLESETKILSKKKEYFYCNLLHFNMYLIILSYILNIIFSCIQKFFWNIIRVLILKFQNLVPKKETGCDF